MRSLERSIPFVGMQVPVVADLRQPRRMPTKGYRRGIVHGHAAIVLLGSSIVEEE